VQSLPKRYRTIYHLPAQWPLDLKFSDLSSHTLDTHTRHTHSTHTLATHTRHTHSLNSRLNKRKRERQRERERVRGNGFVGVAVWLPAYAKRFQLCRTFATHIYTHARDSLLIPPQIARAFGMHLWEAALRNLSLFILWVLWQHVQMRIATSLYIIKEDICSPFKNYLPPPRCLGGGSNSNNN